MLAVARDLLDAQPVRPSQHDTARFPELDLLPRRLDDVVAGPELDAETLQSGQEVRHALEQRGGLAL
jgi:hypothetical protein